jgi:predicted GTPase
MPLLKNPTLENTPGYLLESYIVAAATQPAPVPVESEDGRRLYRALALYIWSRHQRPVTASDIRDLWERIDSIKRGSHVSYGIIGVHFWAADFANSLAAEQADTDPALKERLAAWLDDWPNVCILGHTGRGKSSTINRLFGIKMADISHHRACTSTVSDYRLVTGSYMGRPTGIVLWDAPGYGDLRIPFDQAARLYRRMAKKCDVVVFMLDNDRSSELDLKMFKKLRKRVAGLYTKLVVTINKADLFPPFDWDKETHAPSESMFENIRERVTLVATALEFPDSSRVVPISALKNWNIFALLNAMVDAAGESKGARLLQAVRPSDKGTEGAEGDASSGKELALRFGFGGRMRSHFRALIGKS